MTGFEPWTSGVGNERSSNWATTTAITPGPCSQVSQRRGFSGAECFVESSSSSFHFSLILIMIDPCLETQQHMASESGVGAVTNVWWVFGQKYIANSVALDKKYHSSLTVWPDLVNFRHFGRG